MTNMYQNPEAIAAAAAAAGGVAPAPMDPRQMQEHFEDFYEDIFEELANFGELEVGYLSIPSSYLVNFDP